MHTQARAALLAGTPLSSPGLVRGVRTTDAQTYDQATIDSAGAFLVGELERLDQRVYEPLVSVTWTRDIDLRTDITAGDDFSSFMTLNFGTNGGTAPTGKSWIGKRTTAIPTVSLDGEKVAAALNIWGKEAMWTIPELLSCHRIGRPVDMQQVRVLELAWEMDTDEQVYIGDAETGAYGLTNNPAITPVSVANGAGGSPLWQNKTPDEMLRDVIDVQNAAWAASGWTYIPTKIGVPPAKFAQLARQMGTGGQNSIARYISENSLSYTNNGVALNIVPMKWLVGRGAGGTDRMVAYTQSEDLIRLPRVDLQRVPLQFRGIHHIAPFWGKLGQVEFVRPATIAYRDGI